MTGNGATEPMEVQGLADRLKALSHPKRLHLLRYLTTPHYLEEIASELGTARQSAQEHVKRLMDAGLLKRAEGRRDQTPVTEYTVHPQRIWSLLEELARLAHLTPEGVEDDESRSLTVALGETTTSPASSPARQARLIVVHGLRIGAQCSLTGNGPWLVGRDPHAALVLDWDSHASNRHFEIRRADTGWEVADLYSKNGTRHEWKRLPRGTSAPLANGDLVQAGRSLMLFSTPR